MERQESHFIFQFWEPELISFCIITTQYLIQYLGSPTVYWRDWSLPAEIWGLDLCPPGWIRAQQSTSAYCRVTTCDLCPLWHGFIKFTSWQRCHWAVLALLSQNQDQQWFSAGAFRELRAAGTSCDSNQASALSKETQSKLQGFHPASLNSLQTRTE